MEVLSVCVCFHVDHEDHVNHHDMELEFHLDCMICFSGWENHCRCSLSDMDVASAAHSRTVVGMAMTTVEFGENHHHAAADAFVEQQEEYHLFQADLRGHDLISPLIQHRCWLSLVQPECDH